MNIENDSIAFSVKRRRLNLSASVTTLKCHPSSFYRRKIRLLHLPDEIILALFRKLSFQTIVKTVKLTCVRFQTLSLDLMCLELCKIKLKIEQARRYLENLDDKNKNKNDKIKKVYSMSLLDLIESWYNLIIASTWRYDYFKNISENETLMTRGGLLLDQFNLVLYRFFSDSKLFTYKINHKPSEISSLGDVVKDFLLKFERYQCQKKMNDPFNSGSKIIDLLDCLVGGKRKTILEHSDDNSLNLHLQYTIDQAWFVAFDTGNKKCAPTDHFYNDLRFLFKRLRRLIRANNGFVIDKKLITNKVFCNLNPPIENIYEIYCGFGDINSTFYFYGTMNEEYLRAIILWWEDNENENLENENVEQEENAARDFRLVTNPVSNRPNVKIDIVLNCTPYYSPRYIVKQKHSSDYLLRQNLRTLSAKKSDNDYFSMNVIIESNLAKDNRLPYKYKYSIKQFEPTKVEIKRKSLKSAEL